MIACQDLMCVKITPVNFNVGSDFQGALIFGVVSYTFEVAQSQQLKLGTFHPCFTGEIR